MASRLLGVLVLSFAVVATPAVAAGKVKINIPGYADPFQGVLSFAAAGCMIKGGKLTCPKGLAGSTGPYKVYIDYKPGPNNSKAAGFCKGLGSGSGAAPLVAQANCSITQLGSGGKGVASIVFLGTCAAPIKKIRSGISRMTITASQLLVHGDYKEAAGLPMPRPPVPKPAPLLLSISRTTSPLTATHVSFGAVTSSKSGARNKRGKAGTLHAPVVVSDKLTAAGGTRVVYALRVTNPGKAAAHGIHLSHAIPAGGKVVSATHKAKVDPVKGKVTWSIPALKGKSHTVRKVTVDLTAQLQ